MITIAGQMSGRAPSAAIFVANAAAGRCGRVTITPIPASGPGVRTGGDSGWTPSVMRRR